MLLEIGVYVWRPCLLPPARSTADCETSFCTSVDMLVAIHDLPYLSHGTLASMLSDLLACLLQKWSELRKYFPLMGHMVSCKERASCKNILTATTNGTNDKVEIWRRFVSGALKFDNWKPCKAGLAATVSGRDDLNGASCMFDEGTLAVNNTMEQHQPSAKVRRISSQAKRKADPRLNLLQAALSYQ